MVEQTPRQGFLKRFFNFGPKEPQYTEIKSGVPGVDWKVTDYEIVDIVALHSHKRNIEHLEKEGGHPLTFQEIHNHLGDTYDKWVLFDSTLRTLYASNHWRVLNLDQEKREVTLSFCGSFGNYDMKGVEPFTLSVDTPFFTGLSLQENTHETKGVLPLQEVVDTFKKIHTAEDVSKIKMKHKETIYWVDEVILAIDQAKYYKFIPHS